MQSTGLAGTKTGNREFFGLPPEHRADATFRSHLLSLRNLLLRSPHARDGVYEEDWLAGGYATSRPPVHSQILDQVALLQSVSQIDLALDIGCGAGISTIALMQRGIGNHVLGIDPSHAMIRTAKRHVDGASFMLASAEALPVPSGTVGLLTAAGSLNYADISACFSEAKRVLSREGLLVVYDFSTGTMLGAVRCT